MAPPLSLRKSAIVLWCDGAAVLPSFVPVEALHLRQPQPGAVEPAAGTRSGTQRRGDVAAWSVGRRPDSLKAQLGNIECIDEGIDHANRIALINPVIEAFRQQRRLRPI